LICFVWHYPANEDLYLVKWKHSWQHRGVNSVLSVSGRLQSTLRSFHVFFKIFLTRQIWCLLPWLHSSFLFFLSFQTKPRKYTGYFNIIIKLFFISLFLNHELLSILNIFSLIFISKLYNFFWLKYHFTEILTFSVLLVILI